MDFIASEMMACEESNKIYRFMREVVNVEFSDEWSIKTMMGGNVIRVLKSKRFSTLACLKADGLWYSCYEDGWNMDRDQSLFYMPAGYRDWRMAVVVSLQPEIYLPDDEKAIRLKNALNRCPLRSAALAAYLKRQIDASGETNKIAVIPPRR